MADFIEIATGEAVEADIALTSAGARLFFRVLRREIGDDGGVSIELHCGSAGELLRFDLFRGDPHFHIPTSRAEPTGHIDPARFEDPTAVIADVVARSELEIAEWLRRAGHPALADALGAPPYSAAREVLEGALASVPEPVERMRAELTAEVRRAIGI